MEISHKAFNCPTRGLPWFWLLRFRHRRRHPATIIAINQISARLLLCPEMRWNKIIVVAQRMARRSPPPEWRCLTCPYSHIVLGSSILSGEHYLRHFRELLIIKIFVGRRSINGYDEYRTKSLFSVLGEPLTFLIESHYPYHDLNRGFDNTLIRILTFPRNKMRPGFVVSFCSALLNFLRVLELISP